MELNELNELDVLMAQAETKRANNENALAAYAEKVEQIINDVQSWVEKNKDAFKKLNDTFNKITALKTYGQDFWDDAPFFSAYSHEFIEHYIFIVKFEHGNINVKRDAEPQSVFTQYHYESQTVFYKDLMEKIDKGSAPVIEFLEFKMQSFKTRVLTEFRGMQTVQMPEVKNEKVVSVQVTVKEDVDTDKVQQIVQKALNENL